MLAKSEARIGKKLPYLFGLGTALIVAVLVFLLSYFVIGKGRVDAEARAYSQLDNLRVTLSRELDSMLTTPETMALFIGSNPQGSRETFAKVAYQILSRHNEIISIVLAPDNVIQMTFPPEGNEAIMGMRYLETPEQAQAVQRAIDTQHTVVAGPLPLKQGGFGVASRTPVYVYTADGVRDSTSYWGIVSLTIDADWLLNRSGFLQHTDEFDIAVRGVDGKGKLGEIFGGKQDVFDKQPVTLEFVLPGGGVWEFAAVPTQGWPGFHSGTTVLVALAYTLSLCIGYLTYCLTRKHQMAVKQATHDPLTNLPNRTVLLEKIKTLLASAEGESSCGALCVLDLDKFKPVNDKYGHAAGDKVLQVIAERLRVVTASTGLAVRLGGDEFAVLLCKPAPLDVVRSTGKSILEALKQPIPLDRDITVFVGTSVGATLVQNNDGDPAALLERADVALYASKKAGRGRCTIFEESCC